MLRSLLAAGLALSAALLQGTESQGQAVDAEPAEPDQIAGYHFALRSSQELLATQEPLQNVPQGTYGARLDALNTLVFESLVHGPSRPVSLSQNWLAWSLGWVSKELRYTQMPERVVHGGQGLCHDAVAVLLTLARQEGMEGQMIDLQGHVIASFEEGGQHWVADPDYGFIFQGTVDQLTDAEVRETIRGAGYAKSLEDAYAAALLARDRHLVIPGARLSPRLAQIEVLLNALAWLLPGALLIVLARLAWRKLRRESQKTSVDNRGARQELTRVERVE